MATTARNVDEAKNRRERAIFQQNNPRGAVARFHAKGTRPNSVESAALAFFKRSGTIEKEQPNNEQVGHPRWSFTNSEYKNALSALDDHNGFDTDPAPTPPKEFSADPRPPADVQNNDLQSGEYQYKPGPVTVPGIKTREHVEADEYFVYLLELSNKEAIKIGWSENPRKRRDDYNRKILPELTGLNWKLVFTHSVKSREAAMAIEQTVIAKNQSHQLKSNGEVLTGLDAKDIKLAIIQAAGD